MVVGIQHLRRCLVISASLIEKIERAGLNSETVFARVTTALAEDVRDGDVTGAATIDQDQTSLACFTARKSGILAGSLIAAVVLEECGIHTYQLLKNDGDVINPGEILMSCEGPTRAILIAERTALNFLTHLSGIATLTAQWKKAIAGTSAQVRDTRKTIPGLRELEKYAVRVGGGINHRMTLSDAALIKDNHIVAIGSITRAVERVRSQFPSVEIEVEADTLDQVKEALDAKVEMILLDNMSLEETKIAVELARDTSTKLESSGGLTLESAAAYAATGVDYLAVGALTHSAPALDIGLDF